MKRTIPELREALLEIAERLEALEHEPEALAIEKIVDEMYRSPPARPRAKTKHFPLSERDRQEIREYAKRNPDAHIADIAALWDVNPGRVSEALRGH